MAEANEQKTRVDRKEVKRDATGITYQYTAFEGEKSMTSKNGVFPALEGFGKFVATLTGDALKEMYNHAFRGWDLFMRAAVRPTAVIAAEWIRYGDGKLEYHPATGVIRERESEKVTQTLTLAQRVKVLNGVYASLVPGAEPAKAYANARMALLAGGQVIEKGGELVVK